jgi:hypothetical protein
LETCFPSFSEFVDEKFSPNDLNRFFLSADRQGFFSFAATIVVILLP